MHAGKLERSVRELMSVSWMDITHEITVVIDVGFSSFFYDLLCIYPSGYDIYHYHYDRMSHDVLSAAEPKLDLFLTLTE